MDTGIYTLKQIKDADFNAAYRYVLRKHGRRARFMERKAIVIEALDMPAPRFYITVHEAARTINKMMKGQLPVHKSRLRRKMYFDMFNVFLQWRIENPEAKTVEGIDYVINSQAPGFYMTPEYAMQIKIK
ncbi:MAG: hypothetical protein LBR26_09875 [Prevotella sp.]|nr:hypothetical protein [Prevotella sp.]